jgi:proton-dependent oligopeptide transporter, POT family
LIALAVYLWGFSSLPEDELTKSRAAHRARASLTKDEWHAVLMLLFLCIPLTLYWACYEQQGNTIALFAADNTDRTIDLFFWRGEMPATWIQSFNPFMIFAFTPFVISRWARQARSGSEPSSANKMMQGCVYMAAANLIMVGAVLLAGETGKSSWLWLFVYSAVLTVGEIYLSPISLSLYSKVAPAQILSLMMAVNFIPNFLGGGWLQGWLGTFWSTMSKSDFFLMIAAISAAAAMVVWLLEKPLRRIAKE